MCRLRLSKSRTTTLRGSPPGSAPPSTAVPVSGGLASERSTTASWYGPRSVQAAAERERAGVGRGLVAVEAAQGEAALARRVLHHVAGRHQLLLARCRDGDVARVAERGVALGQLRFATSEDLRLAGMARRRHEAAASAQFAVGQVRRP